MQLKDIKNSEVEKIGNAKNVQLAENTDNLGLSTQFSELIKELMGGADFKSFMADVRNMPEAKISQDVDKQLMDEKQKDIEELDTKPEVVQEDSFEVRKEEDSKDLEATENQAVFAQNNSKSEFKIHNREIKESSNEGNDARSEDYSNSPQSQNTAVENTATDLSESTKVLKSTDNVKADKVDKSQTTAKDKLSIEGFVSGNNEQTPIKDVQAVANRTQQSQTQAVAIQNSAKETIAAQGQVAAKGVSNENVASSNGIKTGSASSDSSAQFGLNSSEKNVSAKVKQTFSSLLSRYGSEAVEKVKELISQASKSKDNNTLTLKLDPQDLGKITVKVTQRDSQVFARVIPENKEVEQYLREKASELHSVLTSVGFKADQIHISFGGEKSEAESYNFQNYFNGQRGFEDNKSANFSYQSEHGNAKNMISVIEKKNINVEDLGWVA
ncbi:MAG: flagellar hook-length control protein FliK [Proteobacteria bacterium]|nr:flagellar hook-length control protein FliK [Pseudomonadota bacterium]